MSDADDSEWTTEPLELSDLSGAVLTWTDPDGTEHQVEFDE